MNPEIELTDEDGTRRFISWGDPPIVRVITPDGFEHRRSPTIDELKLLEGPKQKVSSQVRKYNALDFPPRADVTPAQDEDTHFDPNTGQVEQDPYATVTQTRVVRPYNSIGVVEMECDCPGFQITKPGNARWCKHAQRSVEFSLDVRNPLTGEANPLVGFVEIVLLGIPGVSITFECEPRNTDGEQPALFVDENWQTQNLYLCDKFLERTPPEAIGMISKREGRRVITNVFYDWLADVVDEAHPIGLNMFCKNEHHRGEQPDFSTLPDNFQVPALADAVDILTTGKCRRCNEDFAAPDLDVSPKGKSKYVPKVAGS